MSTRAAGEHEAGRWISIAVTSDEEWRALVREMGEPDWAMDPALATAAGRLARQDDLDRRVGDWTREHDGFALMERLQAAGVPATPVGYPEDIASDAHLAERGNWHELAIPGWRRRDRALVRRPLEDVEDPERQGRACTGDR